MKKSLGATEIYFYRKCWEYHEPVIKDKALEKMETKTYLYAASERDSWHFLGQRMKKQGLELHILKGKGVGK